MKKPFASAEKLREIAAEYGTPVYVYDEAGIIETADRVINAFSWNSGYRQYFAVKATPTAAILKLQRSRGVLAVCSSMAELMLARMCGYEGDEILFAPNYPLFKDIKAASDLKTAVNLDGLELIDSFYNHGALRGPVGMRYNPGGEYYVNGKLVSKPRDAKFGFTKVGLLQGAERLKSLGITGFGLHGYMGGNIGDEDYYASLAQILMETAVEVSRKTGLRLCYINLSGGVGVGYQPDESTPDIEKMALGVKSVFDKVLVPSGFGGTAVYTELGRYMTAPHGILLSKVNYIKRIYKDYIGIDASSADLMRPMLYGAYHHMTVVGREGKPCNMTYDVVGSVPENTDKLAVDRALPETRPGDLIAIHDVGAHGHSMGYNYGGKLRSAEVLLHPDGTTNLIRRRETVDDYLRMQVL